MQEDDSNASNKEVESAALSSDSSGASKVSDNSSIEPPREDTVFFVYSNGKPTTWNVAGPVIQDKPLWVNIVRKEVSVIITNTRGEVTRVSLDLLLVMYLTSP
jgi:hypothetical protein